jgi:hypothetical protein
MNSWKKENGKNFWLVGIVLSVALFLFVSRESLKVGLVDFG